MNNGNYNFNDKLAHTVAKGVAVSGFGNFLLRFIDLAIAILLLRWLSVFEYGIYRLVLAAYDFGAGFYLAGLENVVVSDVSGGLKKDSRRAKALFSVYFYFTLAVGIVLFLIFFFGRNAFSRWLGGEAHNFWIISLLFLLSPWITFFSLRFHILLDFAWETAFRILRDLSRLGAILSFYFFFSFGTKEAIWSIIISYGMPAVAALLFYRRQPLLIVPAFAEVRSSLCDLFFRHGKWALLDDLLANSGKNIRPFIVKTFVGVEAVALISVAQNLIGYISSLFPMREILIPVFPRLADRREDFKKQINRALKYSTAAYILLGIAAALLVPVFVRLLFPKYLSSLPFFYLLLLGFPWLGIRSVLLPVFYALKEQKILFRLTAGRLLFTTVAGIILTYFLGIWGAALELLLVGIVVTPAFIFALKTILPGWSFRFRDLITFDALDREFFSKVKNLILAKIRLFLW